MNSSAWIAALYAIFTLGAAPQASALSPDITTPENGYCIESSHYGANDCNRVFSHSLTNGTYWQNGPETGHWVGYRFSSARTVTSYSILNVNNDPTLKISGWEFQALSGSTWVTIDEQYDFSITYGKRYYFSTLDPFPSDQYRLKVNYTGVDGILITDITMHEDPPDNLVQVKPYLSPSFGFHDWSDFFFNTLLLVLVGIYLFFKFVRFVLDLFLKR